MTKASKPKANDIDLIATLCPKTFKALSDPMRLSIIATLAGQKHPLKVGDLVGCCGIDFSGVSRHLKILKDADILTVEKKGRTVLYALKSKELADKMRLFAHALEDCCSTNK